MKTEKGASGGSPLCPGSEVEEQETPEWWNKRVGEHKKNSRKGHLSRLQNMLRYAVRGYFPIVGLSQNAADCR